MISLSLPQEFFIEIWRFILIKKSFMMIKDFFQA